MPVKFACPACHQWLSVSRRKIGVEVHCPRCQSPFVVPRFAPGAKAVAGPGPSNGPQPATGPPTGPPSLGKPPATPPQSSLALSEPAVDMGRVSVPRWVLYAQGALIALVAGAAFAAGYFWSHPPAPTVEVSPEQRDPVLLHGLVVYRNERGLKMPDADAVLLVIPREAVPDQKIDGRGLRPRDPPPAARHAGLQAIELLDGAYARADRDGKCSLVLRPGDYWVLALSRHASRPKGQAVPADDLEVLERYFLKPAELIGQAGYELRARKLSPGDVLEYEFK